MRVYVIDNGGQWTHREWRVLKYLKVETRIIPNNTPFEKLAGVDALVLSGGAPDVASEAGRMGNNGEYLDKADFPILGICAGMHIMTTHFGGSTGPAIRAEFGRTRLYVDEPDHLFSELPKDFDVWESHNDEVKIVPEGFQILAHSDTCRVEAMRSLKRPLYALQFHPEVENTDFGMDIFRNFLKVVEGWHK
ncbi:MAG: GMP synthase subunit A [Methanomassiliicoccales archaeon]|nr:GMP synthase subunit A [Methanomassiliicoccales archaeon]TFG56285.1 MAG: GMP synthase subunit A [Methanomassiliicoccus sp.]